MGNKKNVPNHQHPPTSTNQITFSFQLVGFFLRDGGIISKFGTLKSGGFESESISVLPGRLWGYPLFQGNGPCWVLDVDVR